MNASPYSLDGKVILVTGASSGIGRACAIMASQMGARLVITGRNEERLQESLAALNGSGHTALPMDLQDVAAMPEWVQSLMPLDGVVHAAGLAQVVPFRMIRENHLDELMHVNFKAPMLLTQQMLMQRKINSQASLVFITAVADHVAPVGTAVYAATKAALTSAVRSLALEGSKHKIRANCVSPGYVNTPMFERLSSTTSVDKLQQLSYFGLIEAEDIASSVMYLLSNASRWVTRSSLVVDGGITIPVR